MSTPSSALDALPAQRKSASGRFQFGREERVVLVWRLAALVAFFGLWQIFAGGPRSILPDDAIGRPSGIFLAFFHLLFGGQLFSALWTTVVAVLYSMLISVPVAAALALLTSVRPGRWALQPIITVCYAVPKVGLISLYIVLLGVRNQSHIALVVSSVVFIYYFGFRQALEEIDPDKVAALRLMGASNLKIARSFIFPSAVPQFFAATRIALPLALATEIFAEIVLLANTGLGAVVEKFTVVINADGAMAVLFFVMFVGYLIDVVVGGRLRRYVESVGGGVESRRSTAVRHRNPVKRTISIILQWAFASGIVYVIWVDLILPRVSRAVLVGPGPTWTELKKLFDSGFLNASLWQIVNTTLKEAVIGFLLGVAIGSLFALSIGLLPMIVGKLLEPIVTAIYAMPKFVIVPVLFVWVGSGLLPRAYLVTLSIFPVIAIYTLTGIRTVDPDATRMMQLFGANRRQLGQKLLTPHTLGYFATALTYSIPHALAIAIGAEILFGTSTGIGGLLNLSITNYNVAGVLAALAIATAISAVLIGMTRAASQRLLGPGGSQQSIR